MKKSKSRKKLRRELDGIQNGPNEDNQLVELIRDVMDRISKIEDRITGIEMALTLESPTSPAKAVRDIALKNGDVEYDLLSES